MTDIIESINDAVLEYEHLRTNGTSRKDLAEWFIGLGESAKSTVRDLMLVDASFMARKNRKGIRVLVWAIGGISTLTVYGAAHAANFDATTATLSAIVAGGVGTFVGLLGQQLRLF